MSQFYADIHGSRGPSTRQGTKASGMEGHVRGWDLGCRVRMSHNGGRDVCHVYLTSGSNGDYCGHLLGSFVVGKNGKPRKMRSDDY